MRALIPLAGAPSGRRGLGQRTRAGCVVLTMSVLALVSCSKKKAPDAAEEPLPPMPAGLVAQFAIANPQALWETIRTELGQGGSLLPRTAPLFFVSTFGLPAASADELDLASPLYGAVDNDQGKLGTVVAIRTRNAAKVRALLARGADGGDRSYFAHVLDEHVVIGTDSRALANLGLYAVRTLRHGPASRHDLVLTVPRRALEGPIVQTLRREWAAWKREREADDRAMRIKHGGSAPDFGDPAEALADMDGKAKRVFGLLADLEELRAEVDFNANTHAAHAAMTARPASTTGIAAEEMGAMDVGDVDPVLALPQSSLVAILMRDSAAVRRQSAEQQTSGIAKVLGSRLAQSDRTKLGTALETWADARGDWLAAGVLWSDKTRAAVIRSSVANPEAMARAPSQLLELLSIPALAAPLATWIGDVQISAPTSTEGPNGPKIELVHVVRRPGKAVRARKGPEPLGEADAIDVCWTQVNGMLLGAVGTGAKTALTTLTPGSSEPPLAGTAIARAIRRLGGAKVAFLAVADGRLLGAIAPGATSELPPALLAYGKSVDAASARETGWLETELPVAAVVELVRGAMATRPSDAPPRP